MMVTVNVILLFLLAAESFILIAVLAKRHKTEIQEKKETEPCDGGKEHEKTAMRDMGRDSGQEEAAEAIKREDTPCGPPVHSVKWLKSMLSHNVRMPLAVVAGYMDLLIKGLIEEKEQQEVFIKIAGNVEYLKNVISLMFDTQNVNEIVLHKKETDIRSCVEETAGYVSNMLKKEGIYVRINCQEEPIVIMADKLQLMRVFYNLFENAVKYMGKTGVITFTIRRIDEEVLIAYKDTGMGIAASDVEYVLADGFRGSNSSEGLGMGLYFVHQIILKHGGSIEVHSENGRGMGIYMRLPAGDNL